MVDLGAAPGGWSQIAVKRVKAEDGRGAVVALDILALRSDPRRECFCCRISASPWRKAGCSKRWRAQADAVLSDMAAPTTGHRATDHLRIMGLRKRLSTSR